MASGWEKRRGIMRRLLERGADIFARDNWGSHTGSYEPLKLGQAYRLARATKLVEHTGWHKVTGVERRK